MDQNTKKTFSDSTFGDGACYTWNSQDSKVGKGKIFMVEVIENQSSKHRLEFEEMNTSLARFKSELDGNNRTKVIRTLYV
jgi:hypothetical protein